MKNLLPKRSTMLKIEKVGLYGVEAVGSSMACGMYAAVVSEAVDEVVDNEIAKVICKSVIWTSAFITSMFGTVGLAEITDDIMDDKIEKQLRYESYLEKLSDES